LLKKKKFIIKCSISHCISLLR